MSTDIIEGDPIIQFEIPVNMDIDELIFNKTYTKIINELDVINDELNRVNIVGGFNDGENSDGNTEILLENYSTLTVTVWIAIVMVFCLATVIFCICSCMFYSKIRRWNREERRRRQAATESNDQPKSKDDILPSYTLVSGLPSYDAALELHRKNSCLDAVTNERPTVFQIFRYENEKQLNSNNEPIVVGTNWTLDTNQSISNNENIKQISSSSSGGDTKNDKLCLSLLTKLQTQISTESSSSCVSEKQQHLETS